MNDEERSMVIEQRNMLLDFIVMFYPNGQSGRSLYLSMLGPFPDYTQRLISRDLFYLQGKGYIERREIGSRKPLMPTSWIDARWAATPSGLEVQQRIKDDPALEL